MFKKEKKITPKKAKKIKAKRDKELKNILSWMEIQKIDKEGIHLQKNSRERIAKGFRVEPLNIFLMEEQQKARAVISLASGLDICKFPIYYKFIKSTPRLTYQISSISEEMKTEKNSAIRSLMSMQIEKLDWFCDTHTEVGFYIMVQDDYDHVDKKLDQIFQVFMEIGMYPKMMTVSDYEAVVKEQFENPTVNEYMFSVLLNNREVYDREFNKNTKSS